MLGALLATVAYFAGNVDTGTATDDELVIRQLTVTDSFILLGDAAIDGRLLMNERVEVGLEPNKLRIMMWVDPNQAQIVVPETAAEDASNQYYVLLVAGRHPKFAFKSAGIQIKERESNSLHLSPE